MELSAQQMLISVYVKRIIHTMTMTIITTIKMITKNGIFEQEEAQLQRKEARVRFPNPYSFLFTILFKLKLGSTPIFKFNIT